MEMAGYLRNSHVAAAGHGQRRPGSHAPRHPVGTGWRCLGGCAAGETLRHIRRPATRVRSARAVGQHVRHASAQNWRICLRSARWAEPSTSRAESAIGASVQTVVDGDHDRLALRARPAVPGTVTEQLAAARPRHSRTGGKTELPLCERAGTAPAPAAPQASQSRRPPHDRCRRRSRLRPRTPTRNRRRRGPSVAVRGKATVHTDCPNARTPSAMRPWTPQPNGPR